MTLFPTITSNDWKEAFKRAKSEPNLVRQRIMSNQIKVSIDCNKIDKSRIKVGEHGRYLDLILIPTPNNQYGHTHLVRQDTSQEERADGVRLNPCGNAKEFFPKPKVGDFLKESELQKPQEGPF